MVTPLRFRAVTSSPNGKWRSIFLTGGSVSDFLSTSLSSSEAGDVLSFLNEYSSARATQVDDDNDDEAVLTPGLSLKG